MDRKVQKRQAYKNLLQKRRDSAFIVQYLKAKAPETVVDAENFLEELRQKYPNKRDLTKTLEFLRNTTEYQDYREFYQRKKPDKKTGSTPPSTDNIAINIPLLPQTVVAENTTPLFPLIPEETYQDLINQITTDPALGEIFNELSINHDDMESNQDDIQFNNVLAGLTPLEEELLNHN